MTSILKTNKLCKSFSTGGIQQHVLKNLDLEIYQGDFTVIMGPSGGGKSTLLYALSGMDKPTLGDIIYENGKNIAKMSENELADFRGINAGFVFQQIYLVDSMAVLDNVLLSGLLNSKDKAETVKRAKKLLTTVGISETDYKKFPNQLSGGEAQRVAVVRAAIHQPKILFADEPTGALNSQNAKTVLDILTEFNNCDQSIVMVTHDINSALRGNRIIYLKDGRIEGELKLDRYSGENEKRKNQIKEFLNEAGW
ncbi:MAG: ABC transporter ATP-binding protein [Erysipelotrichales bacterium]|nr:ABC transporter ATP-binding protein [Erysipelotrichales bacterium]